MLKSKIPLLQVSAASADAEEGIALDREILKRADLWPYERIEVYNLDNGARFSTIVLEAPALSGTVRVQGAACFLARTGQRIAVLSYCQISEADLGRYQPKIVSLR